MGDILIIREAGVPWEDPFDAGTIRAQERDAASRNRLTRVKYLAERFAGDLPANQQDVMGRDKGPWFWFWKFGPNEEVGQHSHESNEVMYIEEGEMIFNGEVCGPGTIIFVESGTTYGPFHAGPNGAKGMIIRSAATP
jgi:hypothetical protein